MTNYEDVDDSAILDLQKVMGSFVMPPLVTFMTAFIVPHPLVSLLVWLVTMLIGLHLLIRRASPLDAIAITIGYLPMMLFMSSGALIVLINRFMAGI